MAARWNIEYTPLNGVTFGYNNTGNKDIDKLNKELFDKQVKEDKEARKAEDRRLDTERAGIKKQKDLEYTNALAQLNLLKDKIKGASPEERSALREQYNNKVKEAQDIWSDLNNYANLASYKSYLNPAKDTAGQTAGQTAAVEDKNNTQKESQGTDAGNSADTDTDTDAAKDKQQEQGTNTGNNTDNNTDTGDTKDTQQGQGTGTNTKARSPYSYGMVEGHGSSTDPSGRSQQLRNQAQMHERQAMDEQKNSQANMQVANRNYRVEAEKNAVSQAASENAQKVANMGNASAGAAALERGVATADYNTHMQRQDQQRAEGVKNQREMWGSKQTAEEERGGANITDYKWRDTDKYNKNSAELSAGEPDPEPEQTPEPEPEQTPEPEPEKPQEPSFVNATPQHVINALLGSSKGEDLRNGTAQNKDDQELYNYVINTYNVQAAPQDTYWQSSGKNPDLYESLWLKDNRYGGDKEGAIKFLRQGRAGKGNDASTNYIADKDGGYTSVNGKNKMNMQVSAQKGATGEYIPDANNGVWGF